MRIIPADTGLLRKLFRNKPVPSPLSLIFICTLLFAGGILFAQTTFNVSGRIYESAGSLPLAGASVYDHSSGKGSVSDTTGRYQLTLSGGRHNIRVSFLGYREEDTMLLVNGPVRLDFFLTQEPVTYNEVVITAEADKDYIKSTQMGEVSLNNLEISKYIFKTSGGFVIYFLVPY